MHALMHAPYIIFLTQMYNIQPLLKSAAGIESRDVAGGFESSYVQVVELPTGTTTIDQVKPATLSQAIFGSTGKFGRCNPQCY